MSKQNGCSLATFLIETESQNTLANSKQNMVLMHDFSTCKEDASAQCRLPMNSAGKHVFKSEVCTARLYSLSKCRSHLRTLDPAFF